MNQRDLDLLSAYLDGELSPSDSTRIEARLRSERELVSVLDNLRATRTLLRKLPKRRAPRNFTLTRKMVGLNPPLPRSYPAFRFATVVATLLFFFTFGVNALAPQIMQSPAFGYGGGGGVDQPELFSAQAPAATEAPALAEASVPVTETPGVAADLVPQPTLGPSEDASARVAETAAAKNGETENSADTNQSGSADGVQAPAPIIPSVWQILFAVFAIAGGLLMAVMRQGSSNRWK